MYSWYPTLHLVTQNKGQKSCCYGDGYHTSDTFLWNLPQNNFSCLELADRPVSPPNLMLTTIDGNVTLTWSRPLNIPQSVSVTYVVKQTSITRPNVIHGPVNTSMTFAILREDDAMECETFTFIVTASNMAGVSTPARIKETIPICKFWPLNVGKSHLSCIDQCSQMS